MITSGKSPSSEPRVLVLGGNRKAWHAQDRLHESATMSGIEAWVYAFGGDYMHGKAATERDIARYDIVFGNTNLDALENLVRLAESRPSSVQWVSLIEGSATDYLLPRSTIVTLLDAGDLVNVINKYSTELFASMTKTKVEYIGIPYPAREIRQLATSVEARRKEIFLCPFLTNRWSEVFVARRLGLPYYGLERRLTRRLNRLTDTIRKYGTADPHYLQKKAKAIYGEPSLDIRQEMPLGEYLRMVGESYMWLNFDERYTWGRYILDAAALGVPVISTRSTGHAEDFFPQLMLEHPFELEKAYTFAKRLIDDKDFCREMSTIPIERFDHLRPEAMKAKLLQALA
jgi:hypothetical protein